MFEPTLRKAVLRQIRRLRTSPAQYYRLIDSANNRKSIDRMIELLVVLDCEIELVTRCKCVAALG